MGTRRVLFNFVLSENKKFILSPIGDNISSDILSSLFDTEIIASGLIENHDGIMVSSDSTEIDFINQQIADGLLIKVYHRAPIKVSSQYSVFYMNFSPIGFFSDKESIHQDIMMDHVDPECSWDIK